MEITLPKKFLIEEEEKNKKAKVIIEPCISGYGLTLGNALRRVLLSSLPGGAAISVKIKNAQHEFTTLENVKEDLVEIALNLKQLRFRVHSDEPVVLKLTAEGEKKITAKDVEENSEVEVINKDLTIATLTDKQAKLEMEITVAKGVGYLPTEEQGKNREKEIGEILLDAIFTPVLNVGLEVEPTRVGQQMDYDKIILDIETDGTVSPETAVQKAAEILANQFSWIVEGGREEIEPVDNEAPVILPETEVQETTAESAENPEINEQNQEEKKESEEDGDSDEENSKQETEEAENKPKKRGRPKKEQ